MTNESQYNELVCMYYSIIGDPVFMCVGAAAAADRMRLEGCISC